MTRFMKYVCNMFRLALLYEILVFQGLKCAFYPDPTQGININLIGGYILNVIGDRVIVKTEVGMSLGIIILTKILWFWK